MINLKVLILATVEGKKFYVVTWSEGRDFLKKTWPRPARSCCINLFVNDLDIYGTKTFIL